MKPKTEAMAFRIWQFADASGWDVTVADVAKHLNISSARVRRINGLKGWSNRYRVDVTSRHGRAQAGLHPEHTVQLEEVMPDV